jgi:ATP phosphoribosyltransferase regulatory subunit
MQAGIEYIGDIDEYSVFEVLLLAAKSLKTISDDVILDISNLDIISEVIGGLSENLRFEMLRCIAEKNSHELPDTYVTETVRKLMALGGAPKDVIPKLYGLMGKTDAVKQLEKLTGALESAGLGNMINIDFSVSGDTSYYNGIVFKGFIKGVPECVLSGGQYDGLMKKMGKSSKAVGFAVYLDSLERLYGSDKKHDVDTVIIYGDGTDLSALYNKVAEFAAKGVTVSAFKTVPDGYKYKNIIMLGGEDRA